ncbi:MAG: LysR family transcriptional regulator [Oscillospiraceae bacterium]|nr:LysR family transcriptional regulator [Oscillospiraceae bacterium]
MNFQQLKYYMVLCDYLNFSKAAESLFISQQGLSTAISNLESEFSTKFFERTPKGLVLTADGEFFRGWSQDILTHVRECWTYFEGRDASRGVVKCVGAQGVMSEFAEGLIERFESAYQGFTVHLREYKDVQCDAVVERGEAELGFGIEPMDAAKFEYHRLFYFTQVCLMRAEHPWAKYDEIPLSLLPTETVIAVDEDFKAIESFIAMRRKRGVDFTPKIRVGEVTAVHRLVSEKRGVGITNTSVAESLATPDTVWRPFADCRPDWSMVVFKKKNVQLTRCAQIFYEYTQRELSLDNYEKIAPAKIMQSELGSF